MLFENPIQKGVNVMYGDKFDDFSAGSWRPKWAALFFWALVTIIIWGLIISVIGVTVGTSSLLMSGIHSNLREALTSSKGSMDIVGYFLISVLLSTGAEISIPLGFGISGGIQATGYVHFFVIMATFIYAGRSVNRVQGDPKAAIYLAFVHGAVMWAIALVALVFIKDMSIGGAGFDAAWRYTLMALIVGVALMFWHLRDTGQVPLFDQVRGVVDGLQRLVSPKGIDSPTLTARATVAGAALPSAPTLDEGQIAARVAWQNAVDGNHIYCRKCRDRTAVWEPNDYCGKCGYVRGISAPEVECIEKCGAKIGKTDKFCFRCGAKQPV